MTPMEFVGNWQAGAWANAALDAAEATAYGCGDYTADMPDEEILRRLLVSNRQRAGAG